MQWNIFPANGLANSVIPPVLAGLTFSTIFAETLGWNFSGLIVPGYLAPIFVVKPISGLVIVVEAIITYILLRILSDVFSRLGIWTRFFGQDAFFALLCISILVKCMIEGPLQPVFGDIMNRVLPGTFDFKNDLHSMGLIVVPLLANIFWRHGMRRNLLPIAAIIGLTYIFLNNILIPYTNFSVNKFELMYSKMAINFEESAHYYFILIIGAAIASHNKYRYGWAYHGMLIPALLGIAWLTPLKIVTTFVEAGVVLALGLMLVHSRLLSHMTMEGPRKLLLLFFIGFMVKMAVGYSLAGYVPGFQALDLYGFAYILPTLLALEMWQGRNFFKVTRLTIQSSFLAAVAGVLICTGVEFALPGQFMNLGNGEKPIAAAAIIQDDTVHYQVKGQLVPWLLDTAKTRMAYGVDHESLSLKKLRRLDNHVFTPLVRSLGTEQPFPLNEKMADTLRQSGLIAVTFEDERSELFWIILEKEPVHYHGLFVFRPASKNYLTMQVPKPLTEIRTLEAGLGMFRYFQGDALLISGTSRREKYTEFDVTHLESKRSLFQLVHQVIHRENIDIHPMLTVQVRGAELPEENEIDMILSTGRETRDGADVPEPIRLVQTKLEKAGLRIHPYRGSKMDINYSTRSNAQQAYVDSFDMGEFAVLWMSRQYRDLFRHPPGMDDVLLRRLGWEQVEDNLASWITDQTLTAGQTESTDVLQADISREIAGFCRTGNIVHLERMVLRVSEQNYRAVDFMDRRSRHRLVCLIPKKNMPGPVMIFRYFTSDNGILETDFGDLEESLHRFLIGRYETLIVKGEEG